MLIPFDAMILVNRTTTKQKLALVIFGLFLGLILLEAGLRLAGFAVSFFRERADRLARGEEGDYVIMCLGESTTADGGTNAYPRQLEEILNGRDVGIQFTVLNKAVSGSDTGRILSRLEKDLAAYKPDMVITMMGINDGPETLAYQDTRAVRTKLFFRGFRVYKLARLLWEHILHKIATIKLSRHSRLDMGSEEDQDKSNGRVIGSKIELDRSGAEARLADQLYKQDKPEAAAQIYKKAIEINPESVQLYIKLGKCYRVRGRWEEAEDSFKKAFRIDPFSEELYAEWGRLNNNRHRWDEAEKICREGIKINPRNFRAYRQLALCFEYQGRWEEAEKIFKEALRFNPQNSELYFSLGSLYRKRKNWEAAERMYRKMAEISPRNNRVCAALALCYLNQGKDELAEEYFNKAAALRFKSDQNNTARNYRKLKEVITRNGVKLICVQYPMRPVDELKEIFHDTEGIVFVDNEGIFKEAVKRSSFRSLFWDYFAGDFGHCTRRGNRLLAENIAEVILGEVIGIRPGKR